MIVREDSNLLGREIVFTFDVECVSQDSSRPPNDVQLFVFQEEIDTYILDQSRTQFGVLVQVDDQYQIEGGSYFIQLTVRPVMLHQEMYFYSVKGFLIS